VQIQQNSSILIGEDRPLASEELARLVEDEPSLSVTAGGANGRDAVQPRPVPLPRAASRVESASDSFGECASTRRESSFSGCESHRADGPPAIEFTKIPPAVQGGPGKVQTIAGRVSGARPGLQIVIYARSAAWWVQPTVASPFVPILSDSTWSTDTHLGYEYAALLVDPGYRPPPT
jgi:hypothetical protein